MCRLSEALMNHANSLADDADAVFDVLTSPPILANAPSAPQISLPSRSGHISPSVAIFCPDFDRSLGISSFALQRLQ